MAELLAKTPASAAWFLWDAALAHALCARATKGDEELQSAYEERAITLLRTSIAAGFDDVLLIKKEPDLSAIRHRADFKALVTELEKKFPAVAPAPHPAP